MSPTQLSDCIFYDNKPTASREDEIVQLQADMSTSPFKREAPDADVEATVEMHTLALPNTNRGASPTPSTVSSLTSLSGTPLPQNAADPSHSEQPPAKRRKLTPAEKAIREREKAEKRARREEEKAKREVEKQKRDEERRQKNEVLEEKRREKELKKQEKEQAKKQEDDEKAKKERAQSRINAFFAKPKGTLQPGKSTQQLEAGMSTPSKEIEAMFRDDSAQATPSKPSRVENDYERTFLPFAAPSHAVVAQPNWFTWDEEYTQKALQDARGWFKPGHSTMNTRTLAQCLDFSPYEAPQRGWTTTSVAQLVNLADGNETDSIALAGEQLSPAAARARIQEHPMKYIAFREDYRPPYYGTNSKLRTAAEALRLARRPVKQIRDDLDYEYDSEAEWEEPEEGEELGSEAEDEEDSTADAEELQEFLDDEGADDHAKPKKRFLNGDMEPTTTGICWEDARRKVINPLQCPSIDPCHYRMEILSEQFDFPIDPFSTTYWPSDTKATDNKVPINIDANRPPLLPRPNIALNGNSTGVADSSKPQKPQKPAKEVRLLSGQELAEFEQVVQGSDLTKQGLLAVVKKKLPKVPNAVLSNTLSTVAARVGAREVDKRWVIVPSD
ncbi:MAG: hypothetical protein Q9162_004393 [Coniocarpon cinnabarinum]